MPLILMLAGLLCVLGMIQEHRIFLRSSHPVSVDLAALEQGAELSNYNIRIGEHIALYPYTIYSYNQKKIGMKDPGPHTDLIEEYYPIISLHHPYLLAMQKLVESGKEDTTPESEYPVLRDFRVLVKTTRFKTLGDISPNWVKEDKVSGLVINKLEPLDQDEKKLIQASWPDVDLDDILVLEEGREPTALITIYTIYGLGLILLGLGLFLFLKRRKAQKTAE